ncbi:unnamed protein product [Nesidiocoris tenuis]|uniref:Uncharacterized protein n=1 Tax=Nesidiocoris tenuis TaxID=355587 RepID=A0A6H5GV62_9HEMI|nr:unnamed protein product [Nesidiocoris tenuis]
MLNAYRLKNNLFNNPWAKSFFCIGRHCLDFLPTVKRAVSFRRVWKGYNKDYKTKNAQIGSFLWPEKNKIGNSKNANISEVLLVNSWIFVPFRELISKWKYWNRPKIENRNGASQKTFSYTFCRNHFLNKYLCVRLSACGYRKKRKDERFHHRVSVGELEVLPVHLESFYNSMRWDLPTQRRVRNAMVTWHLKQETILKSQKSEVSCGK